MITANLVTRNGHRIYVRPIYSGHRWGRALGALLNHLPNLPPSLGVARSTTTGKTVKVDLTNIEEDSSNDNI